MRGYLVEILKKAVISAQKKNLLPVFELPDFSIEAPEVKTHGDYSTNVALKLAKLAKKNPCDIGTIVANEILADEKNKKIAEKIEVVHPGFVNFFLRPEFFQNQAREILKKKEKFGFLSAGKPRPLTIKHRIPRQKNIQNSLTARSPDISKGRGKKEKILIEFLSVNPTGELHLGHGRNAFFGDVLANVLEKRGYKVRREFFINDAKASAQIKELGKTALGKGESYLTDYLKSKIKNLKSRLAKTEDFGEAGRLLAREIQKDNKKFIEKKLKIKFDKWFSEESLHEKNSVKKILKILKEKNLVYEKDGALWLKTSEFGDGEDRVIIRQPRLAGQAGEPTYFLPDIAYHQDKSGRGFDLLIDVWGADHHGYIKRLEAAKKMLGWKPDLKIFIAQMVSLKSKGKALKLSKRKGRIITLEWLVDKAGLDVSRFFYIMKSLDSQMEFDLDLALEQSEKNPVFYVQYAHARISGILRKGPKLKANPHFEMLSHPSEIALMRRLAKFPEITADTAEDFQIHRLPHFALALAADFHAFYRDCKVISEDELLTQARLSLVLSAKIVLKNILDVMGISAPERM